MASASSSALAGSRNLPNGMTPAVKSSGATKDDVHVAAEL